jgi:putative endonuclease
MLQNSPGWLRLSKPPYTKFSIFIKTQKNKTMKGWMYILLCSDGSYYTGNEQIDFAFYRGKQIQGWSRKKKEALINGMPELLPKLAIAYRDVRNESDTEIT